MNRIPSKINNRGYSLVELIVIIAIMSILGVGLITLLGIIPRRHVVACTKNMVYYLEKTRTNAMSFKDAKCYIGNTGDGVFVSIETTKGSDITVSVPEQIGKPNLSISYKLVGEDADVDAHELSVIDYGDFTTSDDRMVFSFDRSAGGFKHLCLGDADQGASVSTMYITRGKWVMQLDLVELTGKITYKWKE